MSEDTAPDMAAAARKALEHYRNEERQLETELAQLRTRLDAVREFLAALTNTPRQRRKPRVVPAPDPLAPPDGVLLTSEEEAAA